MPLLIHVPDDRLELALEAGDIQHGAKGAPFLSEGVVKVGRTGSHQQPDGRCCLINRLGWTILESAKQAVSANDQGDSGVVLRQCGGVGWVWSAWSGS